MTMPACQVHSQKLEISAHSGDMGDMSHCDQHSSDQSSKSTPCDKCFYCHLNVTQAITPFIFAVGMVVSPTMMMGLSQDIPDSEPSALFRPPRLIFA